MNNIEFLNNCTYHTSLIAAFPIHSPMENPVPFSYDKDGHRVNFFHSEVSSYGKDKDKF